MFDIMYYPLGSIGFAQFGRPDYYEKNKIERTILMTFLTSDKFKRPDSLIGLAQIVWKRNPYDQDAYYDAQIKYKTSIDYYDENDEGAVRINKEFYEWANLLESQDLESEELMELCRKKYQEEHPITIIHDNRGNEQGLKSV